MLRSAMKRSNYLFHPHTPTKLHVSAFHVDTSFAKSPLSLQVVEFYVLLFIYYICILVVVSFGFLCIHGYVYVHFYEFLFNSLLTCYFLRLKYLFLLFTIFSSHLFRAPSLVNSISRAHCHF